jgi:hypothetical protein
MIGQGIHAAVVLHHAADLLPKHIQRVELQQDNKGWKMAIDGII